MKLKKDTDFLRFLETVQNCRGEVHFRTDEGDDLNLKSKLSVFLFAALVEKPWLLDKGTICCDIDDDVQMLDIFLV